MRERRTAASWGMVATLAAAAVAASLGACGPTGAFLCQSDAECIDGRGQGVCQSTGYCSFPDGVCLSGQRYGQHSDDFSNECVQADDPIAPTSGDSMTGGGTGGTAGSTSPVTLSTTSATTQTTANTLSTSNGSDATDTAGEGTGDDSGVSADESTGPPGLEADLALWLDFDEGVSTDDSEYAHQPTCISGCPTEASGQFDAGGAFATSGLAVPGHPALDFSGPFTVSVWARAEGAQNFGRGTLVSQPYGDTSSYDLSIQDLDGDTTYDLVSAAEGMGGAALDVFPVGEWAHIAVVYTRSHQEVFVNGVSRINSATPAISSQQADVVVGRFPGALDFGLNGVIDDLRIYRRALASDELGAVMSGAAVD